MKKKKAKRRRKIKRKNVNRNSLGAVLRVWEIIISLRLCALFAIVWGEEMRCMPWYDKTIGKHILNFSNMLMRAWYMYMRTRKLRGSSFFRLLVMRFHMSVKLRTKKCTEIVRTASRKHAHLIKYSRCAKEFSITVHDKRVPRQPRAQWTVSLFFIFRRLHNSTNELTLYMHINWWLATGKQIYWRGY